MKKPKNLGKTLKSRAGFLRPLDEEKGSPDNGSSTDEEIQPPFNKTDLSCKETGHAEIDQGQSKRADVTSKTLDSRKPQETYHKKPVNQADNAGKKHDEKERFSWSDIKPYLKSLKTHSRAEKVMALAWKLYRSSPMTDETFDLSRFTLFMRTAQAEVDHENDPPITMSREEILFIGSDCATRPDEH
ncbi:hypothetical protein H3S84_04710 [Bartonella sp. W8098]|uniref:hypothetical protein n=1 Tax=Bartonella TaxID=773 RepID=UPI0018DB474A|nr:MULTISPECIES: hypothetical protein [Bartonella]MBH9987566.1 hypothetical protein [Bartonella apis]MBI0171426.1 hypothetical protein [Bartonella sp. W8151]